MRISFTTLSLSALFLSGFGHDAYAEPLAVLTPTHIKIAKRINFLWGKPIVRKQSYPILAQVAAVLRRKPQLLLSIEGHTGSRGSRRYNQRLSQVRACAVRRFLIREEGIAAKRLSCLGYGESRPRYLHGRKRRLNRRIEFRIVLRHVRTKTAPRMAHKKKTPLAYRTKRGIALRQPILFRSQRSARIERASFPVIKQIALVMKKNPTLRIRVEGHSDGQTPQYGVKVTLRQACSVRRMLIKMGVSAQRLRCVGFGATRPIASNRTAAGRRKNRRIELNRWIQVYD